MSQELPQSRSPDADRRSEAPRLEPDVGTLRAWFDEALRLTLDHVANLANAPAANVAGALEEARAIDPALPAEGCDPRPLLERLVSEWVPRSFNTAGPGYLAYVPGGGLPTAALADCVAGLTNRYVGVYAAAPLLARLEGIALRWLLDLFGMPKKARGVFTSGGSLANFGAVVCARHDRLGEAFHDGTIYLSDQVHHSMTKAARLAGFARDRVRVVPSEESGRIDLSALRARIAEDRRLGLRPALLVGSAGTVNTGVVDPLDELAEIAHTEGLWFHVDAAYGGFFQATERGRARLRGIERADSVTVDPHKGLFLPYGTGALLVRDGEVLRLSHGTEGDYLPAMQDEPLAQDFCEYSAELSRDFRGLRVWLSVQTFGWNAFRDCLDEKLDLAASAAARIGAEPSLELLRTPDLSLLAFRVRGDDQEGSATREMLEEIHRSRRVMISGTRFRGRFVARFCVLNFRTHQDRLDEAVELAVAAARRLHGGRESSDRPGGSR